MKGESLLRSPRDLPSVEELVARYPDGAVRATVPRRLLVEFAREAIGVVRARLATPGEGVPMAELERELQSRVTRFESGLMRPVINATGILIHTNLGRAPLSSQLSARLAELMSGYVNLEYSLDDGERGTRGDSVVRLLSALAGTEDALVVNNCAAALMLALNTLTLRREVVVSRGELVQIGGGFRIPDILERSGARLVEVGTTNVTTSADYANGLSSRTGLILKMHRSNFAQSGFTQECSLSELAQLAQKHNVPLLHDIGSGLFVPLGDIGGRAEPTVQSSVASGADIVCFSTDKLLGALQAGILAGSTKLVQRIKKNPMYRALRPDKYTLAVLQECLLSYHNGAYREDIPIWSMAAVPESELYKRARTILSRIGSPAGVSVEATQAQFGGGSTPDTTLPSVALVVASSISSSQSLARALRKQNPPVIGRTEKERYLLDLRAVMAEQDELIITALLSVLSRRKKEE